MSLKSLVDLYRCCKQPPVEEGCFSATVGFGDVRGLIGALYESMAANFELLLVDGEDVEEALPQHGGIVEFRLRLPASSAKTFHHNLSALLAADIDISHGCVPEEFYLLEEDYYTGDPSPPPLVAALGKVCRFISGLAKLAHYHDQKSARGSLRLVFVQPGASHVLRPVEVDTRVSSQVLQVCSALDTKVVDQLSDPNAVHDAHYPAMVGVFGSCLANFLSGLSPEASFLFLVERWQEFLEEYHRDLGTFLSGFAFHKAKTEVAEAEIKIATEFSKVISDITGKLLGIPISLAAVIAMCRPAASLMERVLLLLVLGLASVILLKTVSNQRRQFFRIAHAKSLVLSSIQGRAGTYPSELAAAVQQIVSNLRADEDGLRSTLNLFRVLSWLPIVAGIIVLVWIYRELLSDVIVFTLGAIPI